MVRHGVAQRRWKAEVSAVLLIGNCRLRGDGLLTRNGFFAESDRGVSFLGLDLEELEVGKDVLVPE